MSSERGIGLIWGGIIVYGILAVSVNDGAILVYSLFALGLTLNIIGLIEIVRGEKRLKK
jgi:hypothetical protein